MFCKESVAMQCYAAHLDCRWRQSKAVHDEVRHACIRSEIV